jgi:hypothetical protein
MMTEEQKNLKALKKMNEKETLGERSSRYPKFLKNGLTWNGVESAYNIYLKHRFIKMGF